MATWTRGSVIQAAAFDVSPPAFTAVNVPATGTTGQPVAASATTLDTWSALGAGQPSWNFGDGKLASGSSVTHVYAAPGTYTVTVGASDAVGNASPPTTRQIVITNAPVPPPPPTPPTSVAKPKLKAAWKASHLVGTLSLSGTDGREHDVDHLGPQARRQEDRVQEHVQGEERQVDAHAEAPGARSRRASTT